MAVEVDYKQIGKKIVELIASDGTDRFCYVSKRMEGGFYGTIARAIAMYDSNTMLLERVYASDAIGLMAQKVKRLNAETSAIAADIKKKKTDYFTELENLEKENKPHEEFLVRAAELENEYVKYVEDLTKDIEVGYDEVEEDVPIFKYFDADTSKAICPVFSIQDEPIETMETYYELVSMQMLGVYDTLIYGGVNKLGTGDYVILLQKIATPQYLDIVAKFIEKDEAYKSGLMQDEEEEQDGTSHDDVEVSDAADSVSDEQ